MLIKLISFIVVFTVIVLAHELGHFFFSRLAGIKVLELGMGLGPRILMLVKGGTKYTLNLLPLGGFVRIAGLDEDSKDPTESFSKEESYLSKTPKERLLSIFGGPLFNLLLAFIIFYLMFTITGVPKKVSNEIALVSPGSEASRVGIIPGDKIVSLDKKPVTDITETVAYIHNNPGKKMIIVIERSGQKMSISVTPTLNKKLKMGLIGFSLKPIYERTNPLIAFVESIKQVIGTSMIVLYTLGMLIIGKISLFDLAGPVGIAQFTGQVAGEGIVPLLSFTAFLSINLGLLNLLPIPALDGARLVFIIIEWIRKKAIDAELENKIHQVGFTILLSIMALVTVNDIIRIFRR